LLWLARRDRVVSYISNENAYLTYLLQILIMLQMLIIKLKKSFFKLCFAISFTLYLKEIYRKKGKRKKIAKSLSRSQKENQRRISNCFLIFLFLLILKFFWRKCIIRDNNWYIKVH